MTKAIRKIFDEYLDLDVSSLESWELYFAIGVFILLFLLLILFS